jgi:hypothetical protein
MEFDQAEYIKTQNEKEAAERAGKPVEPPKPEQPAVVAEIEDDEEEGKGGTPDPQRSARRRERGLVERAAKAEARAELLQELLDKGMTPKQAAEVVDKQTDEDPEPQRKDFPDDAQYNRALGRWDARQEAAKLMGTKEEKEEAKKQEEAWREGVKKMDAKAAEDVKLIPDWDETAKAMEKLEEEDSSLRFAPSDQPTLFALLMQSDVRAFMYHHFAKNPDDLRKILAMKPNQQIPFFNRLEGRVEKLYSTEQQQNVSDKKAPPKQETAAERDAKKPKPSEAGAPRGGSAPVTTIKPYLEDGRTINPAWKAQQNEREGLRR